MIDEHGKRVTIPKGGPYWTRECWECRNMPAQGHTEECTIGMMARLVNKCKMSEQEALQIIRNSRSTKK